MRVMVVSIGSRGSHIPAMTPRRLRRGVIAGMFKFKFVLFPHFPIQNHTIVTNRIITLFINHTQFDI